MGIISKMLGGDKAPTLLEEVDAILHKIRPILEDDQVQMDMLPPQMKEDLSRRPAYDVDPNGKGPFGFGAGNPIPVNGPIGELAYLSKLETLDGRRIFFHRLGSIGVVDVFEAVTVDARNWFIFFADLYHPRKSRLAPDGFKFSENVALFSGFTTYCDEFPYDFSKHRAAHKESALGLLYMSGREVQEHLSSHKYIRPPEHQTKLEFLLRRMEGRDGASIRDTASAEPEVAETGNRQVSGEISASERAGSDHAAVQTTAASVSVDREVSEIRAAGLVKSSGTVGNGDDEPVRASGLKAGLGILLLQVAFYASWMFGIGFTFYRFGVTQGIISVVAPPYAWYRAASYFWVEPRWKKDWDVKTGKLALLVYSAAGVKPESEFKILEYEDEVRRWLRTVPERERAELRIDSIAFDEALRAYIAGFFASFTKDCSIADDWDQSSTIQRHVAEFSDQSGFMSVWNEIELRQRHRIAALRKEVESRGASLDRSQCQKRMEAFAEAEGSYILNLSKDAAGMRIEKLFKE